jgi:SpoVK/Ycf46/Vps4 family AAA+-type ATPase
MLTFTADRCAVLQDFANAVRNIRPSVSKENLAAFQKWADQYGVSR